MAVTSLSRKQISSRSAPDLTLLTYNSHPYLQGQTKIFTILWRIMLRNELLQNGISILKQPKWNCHMPIKNSSITFCQSNSHDIRSQTKVQKLHLNL